MSNPYPGGESGPRRSTPISPMADESMDTVAANAEAARLARELGVVGSTQPISRPLFSRFRTTTNNSLSSNAVPEKQEEPSSYVRMKDDSQRSSSAATTTTTTTEFDTSPSYPVHFPHITICNSQGEPIHEFDCHGQRTPYKEGPYFLSRDAAGRLVKKRWCKCTTALNSCVWCTVVFERI